MNLMDLSEFAYRIYIKDEIKKVTYQFRISFINEYKEVVVHGNSKVGHGSIYFPDQPIELHDIFFIRLRDSSGQIHKVKFHDSKGKHINPEYMIDRLLGV